MKPSDFHFELPEELVAQNPTARRDDSRLMLVERRTGQIEHLMFQDLPDLLNPRDLLVFNNTKVFPARLFACTEDGKSVEVLLAKDCGGDCWEALVRPGKRALPGRRLVFKSGEFEACVLKTKPDSAIRLIRFEYLGDFWGWIRLLGRVPLPPYIKRKADSPRQKDQRRYQTVFAHERGSVAAPTAGLHFTTRQLQRVAHCFLTLHVGYGTFKPIKTGRIEDHKMDPEFYKVGVAAASKITRHINGGAEVLAVGSTTTRVLEHVWQRKGRITADCGWTDLFIYPGFQFNVTKGLVTNFHLPGSTLLLLVSAFAGTELTRECYRQAIEQKYRFYSYGDAMLVR